MSESLGRDLLAIDVGSSRVKFGWYRSVRVCASDTKLREPDKILEVSHVGVSRESFFKQIGEWLEKLGAEELRIFVASVHAEAAERVEEVLRNFGCRSTRHLMVADLPLEVQVEQPSKVGIDRLLNAVAANRLRASGRAAIVVDFGTANTVDLITAEGAFAGGAILPGMAMSARALHDSTSALPHLPPDAFEVPASVVGKSTHEAIASGLYWGAVGAVSKLVFRMGEEFERSPQLFVTGGDARLIGPNLVDEDGPARHVPQMVLAGIYLAAEELS